MEISSFETLGALGRAGRPGTGANPDQEQPEPTGTAGKELQEPGQGCEGFHPVGFHQNS